MMMLIVRGGDIWQICKGEEGKCKGKEGRWEGENIELFYIGVANSSFTPI